MLQQLTFQHFYRVQFTLNDWAWQQRNQRSNRWLFCIITIQRHVRSFVHTSSFHITNSSRTTTAVSLYGDSQVFFSASSFDCWCPWLFGAGSTTSSAIIGKWNSINFDFIRNTTRFDWNVWRRNFSRCIRQFWVSNACTQVHEAVSESDTEQWGKTEQQYGRNNSFIRIRRIRFAILRLKCEHRHMCGGVFSCLFAICWVLAGYFADCHSRTFHFMKWISIHHKRNSNAATWRWRSGEEWRRWQR